MYVQTDVFLYKFLLVPIHENKKHWKWLVVDKELKEITYYDPLGASDGKDYSKTLADLLVKRGRARKYKSGKITENFTTTKHADSGVFLCMNARKYADTEWVLGTPEEMRKQITEELREEKLKN